MNTHIPSRQVKRVAGIIDKMSDEEKMQLGRTIKWDEADSLRATLQTTQNEELMNEIQKGLAHEQKGEFTPIVNLDD